MFKKLNICARILSICVTLPFLTSCATSGPTFSQMQASELSLAVNSGRIYIYRTSILGAAIQPSVKIDGVVIGDAVPQGFFYVDRPAGSYKISASTEVERDLSVVLEANQKRYVRLDVSIGFFAGHISPTLVDNIDGASEIKDCHFIGDDHK